MTGLERRFDARAGVGHRHCITSRHGRAWGTPRQHHQRKLALILTSKGHLLLTMSGSNTTASLRKRAMVVEPPKAKYPISSPLVYVLPTSAVKRMEPT